MWTVAFLQLSWLASGLSTMRSDIPDQEPWAVPGSTSVLTEAGLPVRAKSSTLQAGPGREPPSTGPSVAVTSCTYTLLVLRLSKLPARGTAGPPGYRPAIVEVCLTVMPPLVPDAALPVPLPLLVQ